MFERLTLDQIARTLVVHRLATLGDVWALGFADVRRAAAILAPQSRAAAPRQDELATLMQAFPDIHKEANNG